MPAFRHDTLFKVETRSSLPVFVVPEQDVLLRSMHVIENIISKGDLVVAVAEGTLKNMDKMKKDEQIAREALRWIDNQLSKGTGSLRICPAANPMECAEYLAAQSPTTTTVIATVLTMSNTDLKPSLKCEFYKCFTQQLVGRSNRTTYGSALCRRSSR